MGIRVALYTIFIITLGGCAPRLQAIGPDISLPGFSGDYFHTADGVQLPLRTYLPRGGPKAVILALHGFNDYSKAFEEPGAWFAKNGVALYAYDQRGFGLTKMRGIWPGENRMVGDALGGLRILRAKYPRIPLFLLGESMGGSVAILAATQTKDSFPADGLILSAPAVWGWNDLSTFSRWLFEQAAHIVPWLTVRPEGVTLRASSNDRVLRGLWRDRYVIKDTRVDAAYYLVDLMSHAKEAMRLLQRPRHLVLYGRHEAILPGAAVEQALKNLPIQAVTQQRIAIYKDGYHLLLRDNDAGIVLKDILSWIKEPGAALPSGADDTVSER